MWAPIECIWPWAIACTCSYHCISTLHVAGVNGWRRDGGGGGGVSNGGIYYTYNHFSLSFPFIPLIVHPGYMQHDLLVPAQCCWGGHHFVRSPLFNANLYIQHHGLLQVKLSWHNVYSITYVYIHVCYLCTLCLFRHTCSFYVKLFS